MARQTSTATTSSKIRCTCATSMRQSCTASASTTTSSPTNSRDSTRSSQVRRRQTSFPGCWHRTDSMTVTLGGLITRAKMTRRVWIASLALMAMLLLFPLVVRLDGRQHADWQQFLGRFHPLAVHLPIGLIALIPLLEMVGTRRPALRETAGFVLALACATCVASVALGYLLAYGSGDTGSTLSRHLWGGVALTIGLLLCILSRPQWSEGGAPRLYPSLLACVLLALVWTAHQGGSLTHGSNYLTQFMPAPLKRIATLTAADAAATNPNSFYS